MTRPLSPQPCDALARGRALRIAADLREAEALMRAADREGAAEREQALIEAGVAWCRAALTIERLKRERAA